MRDTFNSFTTAILIRVSRATRAMIAILYLPSTAQSTTSASLNFSASIRSWREREVGELTFYLCIAQFPLTFQSDVSGTKKSEPNKWKAVIVVSQQELFGRIIDQNRVRDEVFECNNFLKYRTR
jgi:hypothetical protein